MLEFIQRGARFKKMHWLIEEYTEAKRKFPEAKFSFVGHSNGTYLLAQALEDYPEVKFERVAFAGSVVSKRYHWNKIKERGQVQQVWNLMADADWVVSFLPRLADIFPLPLQKFVGPNLGGAGVVPFRHLEKNEAGDSYYKGGHSAAIQESNWRNLVEFTISSEAKYPSIETNEEQRKKAKFLFGKITGKIITPIIILLALALVSWVAWIAWNYSFHFLIVPIAPTICTLFSVAITMNSARDFTIEKRKKMQKLATVLFSIGSACIVLSIVIIPFIFPSSNIPQGIQAITLGTLFIALYKILTKV